MIQLAEFPPDVKLVVVGVSGGPDSLCLLDLLRRARAVNLVVAHFNHQLRPESGAEVEYVRSLAHTWGLPFVTESADVRQYAEHQSLSLEEAARHLRYQFLFNAARQSGAGVVAVAHNADDQVETVLMHFLRGAGLSGLQGMRSGVVLEEFDEHIPLYRPLLHVSRAEIEAYCKVQGLSPVYDATNRDQTYYRNRLRHSLIPEMEKYNPRVKVALLRMVRTLQGDSELLVELMNERWGTVFQDSGPGWLAFDHKALNSLSSAWRRNIFRRAIYSLRPGLRDVDFPALERAALLHPCDLPGSLRLFTEGDRLYLAAWEADLPSAAWPQLSDQISLGNGQFRLGNGWEFLVEFSELNTADRLQKMDDWSLNADNWTAWLDAELITEALIARRRRPGDRFSPLGMGGRSIKVQDFFVNVKLPVRARSRWPLVCVGDDIAWVPGFRLAHPFRITEKTKRVLHISLRR